MSAKGFDFSEFEKFTKNFKSMQRQFDEWLYSFLMKEGLKFIREVKRRTPVDTGDLRQHWKISHIEHIAGGVKVWFINTMYYATFVEYGHAKPYKSGAAPGSKDWVEGYFMMTISLDNIQRSLPRRFDAQFMQFIRQTGVM